MKPKYYLWAVVPRMNNDGQPVAQALLYVALGRKKDFVARWYELQDRIEIFHRVNRYCVKKNPKMIKFICYNTFDYRPDVNKAMIHLARQFQWLIVEDLTEPLPRRIV